MERSICSTVELQVKALECSRKGAEVILPSLHQAMLELQKYADEKGLDIRAYRIIFEATATPKPPMGAAEMFLRIWPF
jgi:hypothetical protein